MKVILIFFGISGAIMLLVAVLIAFYPDDEKYPVTDYDDDGANIDQW